MNHFKILSALLLYPEPVLIKHLPELEAMLVDTPVAHGLLVTAYHLLAEKREYVDLGAGHFDKKRTADEQAERMVRKLERLGYSVDIRPAA